MRLSLRTANKKRGDAERARRVRQLSESKQSVSESKKPETPADAAAENPYSRLLRKIREGQSK